MHHRWKKELLLYNPMFINEHFWSKNLRENAKKRELIKDHRPWGRKVNKLRRVSIFGMMVVKFYWSIKRKERKRGDFGKALLASSIASIMVIAAMEVLMGERDLIAALDMAVKVIPFMALWVFVLISLFDRGFLFDEEDESRSALPYDDVSETAESEK
ncbi:hypothetical protein E3E26_02300 [Thermococcus sp. LS1]|uniref:hypothetical protein n=1 Tax=Thermococcus sp. LS1 TaxID=1638259 RepID=UPI00143A0C65|nr:hypothetical protein [Thermococcus sp. LS1]NJD98629.1 hypothetical protein [Thermococcus sp. LS1]